MYVCLEYSFNGKRKSQTIPTITSRADKYGGTFKSRGSRLKAKIVVTSRVVSLRR